MNEIYAELRSVASRHPGQVVAKLIFFLVPQHGKRRDARDELIVAVRLKAGNCARRRRERKRQRESLGFVSRLRQMKAAGVQHEGPKPIRRKSILLAEYQT